METNHQKGKYPLDRHATAHRAHTHSDAGAITKLSFQTDRHMVLVTLCHNRPVALQQNPNKGSH